MTEATPTPPPETVLYEGHPPLIASVLDVVLSVVTVGLALIYFYFRSRSLHYKITNERVVIERGLLSKRMDQIDLYRINDYVVERPFGQRLVGTGNLLLSAMDRSTPDVTLANLKTDVMVLYEQLRKATETQKRLRGVRTLDAEYSGDHHHA